jgi:peptidoglycan-associated lipoprotein
MGNMAATRKNMANEATKDADGAIEDAGKAMTLRRVETRFAAPSALAHGEHMNRLHVITLAIVVACVAGCKTEPMQEPRQAAQAGAGASASSARGDTTTPTSGSIHIDMKIITACGNIPTAHFAFDSSTVRPDADVALAALARCFVSGPLAGRSMRLVGHADPRGEAEYNLGLGQRRAASVGDYLTKDGMDKGHLSATSRGDQDATGTDEAGWARDRKVDVFLVE